MIVKEFAVSLQPAEIRKCVGLMRDCARACISLNGACFESQLNQLRKVHMKWRGFSLKRKCPNLVRLIICLLQAFQVVLLEM